MAYYTHEGFNLGAGNVTAQLYGYTCRIPSAAKWTTHPPTGTEHRDFQLEHNQPVTHTINGNNTSQFATSTDHLPHTLPNSDQE